MSELLLVEPDLLDEHSRTLAAVAQALAGQADALARMRAPLPGLPLTTAAADAAAASFAGRLHALARAFTEHADRMRATAANYRAAEAETQRTLCRAACP